MRTIGKRIRLLRAEAKKLEHSHSYCQVAKWPILIGKNLPGSFTGAELKEGPRERDIEQVAICGHTTQMCCDTTAPGFSFGLPGELSFGCDGDGGMGCCNGY